MSFPTLRSPRLCLVLDPEDHVEHHRAASSFHDLRAGRVVCQLKPGPQTTSFLAQAVLESLGKDLDLRGNSHSGELNWRRSALWLRAEGIDELIVLRAQHLDFRGYGRMVALAAQADCGLTLVLSGCFKLDRRRERAVAPFPFRRLPFSQWLTERTRQWPPTTTSDDSGDAWPAFPAVPGDDFPLFRASARRLLTAPEFAIVDESWTQAYRVAVSWAGATEVIDESSVADFLRGEMRTARSYSEVLTKLRGLQAAFFRERWLVKVDPEIFAASALREPYDLLTEDTARKVRGFVPPRYAAAATLALVTREPTAVLTELRLGDITERGSSVRIRHARLAIPPAFAPFVVAQRLELLSRGAAADTHFFVSEKCPPGSELAAMTATAFSATLKRVARETGVLVTRDFTRRRLHADAVHWTHRRGVSVVRIFSETAEHYYRRRRRAA